MKIEYGFFGSTKSGRHAPSAGANRHIVLATRGTMRWVRLPSYVYVRYRYMGTVTYDVYHRTPVLCGWVWGIEKPSPGGRCPSAHTGADEGNGPGYAGGPFPAGRRGRRPLQAGAPDAPRAQAKRRATGAPGSSRPTNGAAFYRGIPAFQSRRGGPAPCGRPRAGLGPAPTKGMEPSLHLCRGGCPHPPAVPLSRT